MSWSIKEKSLTKFDTNLFKFLNVEEVFNMYWGCIFSVDGSYAMVGMISTMNEFEAIIGEG